MHLKWLPFSQPGSSSKLGYGRILFLLCRPCNEFNDHYAKDFFEKISSSSKRGMKLIFHVVKLEAKFISASQLFYSSLFLEMKSKSREYRMFGLAFESYSSYLDWRSSDSKKTMNIGFLQNNSARNFSFWNTLKFKLWY